MEEFGRDAFAATMYIKRCGSGSAGVCERAAQRLISIYIMPWL